MAKHSPTTNYQLLTSKQPRVALVHDWFVGGGAEKVVLELHKMFPKAPIYTSYCSDEWRRKLDGKVVTGYLQNWPFSKLRKFIPFLRGWWFQGIDLSGYDLVISSSGAEAKFVKTKPDTVHISYIHAPTHYYWLRYNQYLNNPGFGAFDWLARVGLKVLVGPMRRWDYRAAQRPDYLIANSKFTKAEIKKYYGRESVVIHPAVDIDRFKHQTSNIKAQTRKGFVITGRQTPYKRFDLAVAACTKLNLPLTVVGDGPEHEKLKSMAGPSVRFTGRISEKEVAANLQSAEAFIFPGLDDFGIAAIEAMAAGTPVIAYGAGGALDYVVPGKTGLLFEKQTIQSLQTALESFKNLKFNEKEVVNGARKFSPTVFKTKMQFFIRTAKVPGGQTNK